MNRQPPCRLLQQFAVALGSLAVAPLAPGAEGARFCASVEQAHQVQEFYQASPQPPPFMAAPKLGMPEATVVSALGPDRAVGVSAGEFFKVWDSLRQWDDALALVLKGGQVFEIHGKVHGGQPSKVSKNYNLDEEGPGLSGHMRPDLMSAIYAIDLPGKEGPVKGVVFYDAKGDSAFSIFVPPQATKPGSPVVSQFEATRELIRQLPRLCPAPRQAPK